VPPVFGLSVAFLGGFGTSYQVSAAFALAGAVLLALPQRRRD
jgi:hypothetical protein